MDENMLFPLQQLIAETMRGKDGEKGGGSSVRPQTRSATRCRSQTCISGTILPRLRKACFRALKRL